MKVALVTSERFARFTHEDASLVGAFADRGIEACPRVWTDAAVDWSNFDCAAVRSTWDYHLRSERFSNWITWASSCTKLANAPELLHWNMHKQYLLELGRAGFNIVPTVIVRRGEHLGATKIINAATLTGACVVALWHAAGALMGNDEHLIRHFLAASKSSGERYWHMPLFDDYVTDTKSEIADLRNATGRAAGSLTAGAFLKSFVGDTPWIHLDSAGTAYLGPESAWQAKGPTGTPVRAFVSFVEWLETGEHKTSANGAAAKTATV